ncbi:MAG: hypothetical protein ACJARO_002298 [Bacteriovoracaceae bacterium]|jgi:hypothetical protein
MSSRSMEAVVRVLIGGPIANLCLCTKVCPQEFCLPSGHGDGPKVFIYPLKLNAKFC